MSLKKIVSSAAPRSVRDYVRDIQARLSKLEAMEATVSQLGLAVEVLERTVDTLLASPSFTPGDDVGFNGQAGRKAIFADILRAVPIDAIVETGTWIGNTAGYMSSEAGIPVITTEINQRFHLLAASRLAGKDITVRLGDSRDLLNELSGNADSTASLVFFYLDAHWYDDLPLREELTIIASHWKRFVVMVDDFAVPGDSGYGYDAYGPGKTLTIDHIQSVVDQFDLSVFFPSMSSASESGGRRGCVVLASAGDIADSLERLQSLTT